MAILTIGQVFFTMMENQPNKKALTPMIKALMDYGELF
jgi:hypothetical protein